MDPDKIVVEEDSKEVRLALENLIEGEHENHGGSRKCNKNWKSIQRFQMNWAMLPLQQERQLPHKIL